MQCRVQGAQGAGERSAVAKGCLSESTLEVRRPPAGQHGGALYLSPQREPGLARTPVALWPTCC